MKMPEEFEAPPVGTTDIRAWNRMRREELRGRKRTRYHRQSVDRAGNVGKVRSIRVTHGKEN